MGILYDEFHKMITAIGMKELNQPIFYQVPIGIRFEIGGNEEVYLENQMAAGQCYNPEYVSAALNRAAVIFHKLPGKPDILRIDGYPGEADCAQELIRRICKESGMTLPDEQLLRPCSSGEDDEVMQLQLYWNLSHLNFHPEQLLRAVITADIGGYSEFVSNVYFADTQNTWLYHLYDDRGADIIAARSVTLEPIFSELNDWILDYDRQRITDTFAAE